MRRRFPSLVAVTVAGSLLTGLSACAGAGSEAGDKVTLQLVALEHGDRSGNSSKRYWDKLIGEFTFDHPEIAVQVEVSSRRQIDKRVADLVAAGEAPDLAQTGGSFAAYAAKDELYNAREVLSTTTQGAFVPALAEAGTVRRTQYGLPFVANTRGLFYNKELFERAGLDGPPETWSELREDAEALRATGVDTPYALPLGKQEAEAEALNWMLSGGGGYSDDAGRYDIAGQRNLKTFEWLRSELVSPGLTNEHPASFNRGEAYAAFLKGKVGMLSGHPTLMQRALESGVDYGVAPLPGKSGPVEAATGFADWMMAFKQGGHQEEIRTFLDFVYREKHVVAYADKYDLLPVTSQASQAMRADKSHRSLWRFLDWLETARFYPIDKRSWAPTVRLLRSEIGDAVRPDADPRAVLGALQRKATARESARRN